MTPNTRVMKRCKEEEKENLDMGRGWVSKCLGCLSMVDG